MPRCVIFCHVSQACEENREVNRLVRIGVSFCRFNLRLVRVKVCAV